ncbi:aminoglycoside phosphotransferase family protein [Candidatus Sumerlaeota bacterium]|nr:aminoglycoside phosphotransferase family protein [Candidatus Sumerlaeota bacterium]
MQPSLEQIGRRFQIEGEFFEAQRIGTGHINDTFRAVCREGAAQKFYVLQRINQHVFHQPIEMMQNIQRVVAHCRMKLQAEGAGELDRRTLTLIPATDGGPCCRDEDGEYWRAYLYIEGAQTNDAPETPEQAYQAAREFGRFQRMLTDLPAPPLHDTIPHFHHGPSRFAALQQAIETDVMNRAAECRWTIDWAIQHRDWIEVLPRLAGSPEMPWRVTHNDTKFNNVLLDAATGKALCVIDLDTVMPGLALYDFGDLARSTLSRAPEDERDLARIDVRLDFFDALVRGYLDATREILTSAERDHLVFSCELMTYIIGVRFLTDHLNGDAYFKIHRHSQNLDRARAQFKLIDAIMKNEDAMKEIVARYI